MLSYHHVQDSKVKKENVGELQQAEFRVSVLNTKKLTFNFCSNDERLKQNTEHKNNDE
jgi:hypothetical protein